MNATLYLPHQLPQAVSIEGLVLPDPITGFVRVPGQVPVLMSCEPSLVDVLATGPGYVAYSIFDCEGPVNLPAMTAVSKVSGIVFDPKDDFTTLCGAILLVTDI